MSSSVYARGTTVSPEQTRGEIERTLARYGATAFGYLYEDGRATVAFKAHGRSVRLSLPIEPLDSFKYDGRRRRRTQIQMQAAYEKALRQKWRALALVVKAKLEAVQTGLVQFEEEFMAYIVLTDGSTVGETVVPMLDAASSGDVYHAVATAAPNRQLPSGGDG